jgi:hypothetical protein
LALFTAQPLGLLIMVSDSSERVLAANVEVHHVVRLVEQHRRMLPGPLFGTPVGKFRRHHRIDIGTKLRIAQHADDIAILLQKLVKVGCGHAIFSRLKLLG